MKSYPGCSVLLTILILIAMAAPAPADYCTASGDSFYEYISRVVVGDINNTSNQDFYADYTSLSTTMETGHSYEIEVYNPYQDYDDECGIWVDWNQDEDFNDAGEQIDVENTPGPGWPYMAFITPPLTALAGNTRMRIRVTWDETPLPCGDTDFGEVEDYTINVAESTTMLLEPVADAYVSWDYPNTNYGTETKLTVGEKDYAGYIPYLKFDLSAIPPGNAIYSAELHLYAYEVSSYAPGVRLQRVFDDSWQETEITAANAPGPYYEDTPIVTIVPGDNVWDVSVHADSSYVYDGICSVQLGYILQDVDEYYALFASREHPTTGFRPYLEIEYGVPFCGGTGTADDPYQICTAKQMNNIGRLPARWSRNYKLMADISLSDYTGSSYNIIGRYISVLDNDEAFKGDFDGNNHSISGFSYSASNVKGVGLFGNVYLGTIKNLKVVSPSITDPGYDDMEYVGALAGCASGANIYGCSVVGGNVEGEQYVGGLVGELGAAFIADCSSSATVSAGSYAGGLAGGHSALSFLSNISNSYANGSVSGGDYVGGFIADSSNDAILNCYSTGTVSGTSNVGGFSGCNVNGIIQTDNVVGCFWDVDSSGEPNSAAGTPLPTAQMQDQNTFTDAGWDFIEETNNGGSDDWAMPAGGGYPVLWYELLVPPSLPTFAGGSGTAEDPYLIETTQQLNSIGHNPRLMDKHFKLISDIDMDGEKFYPIADRPYAFTGTFDGNNLTISNIEINPQVFSSQLGLIGSLKAANAKISNLTLVEPNAFDPLCWNLGTLVGLNEAGSIVNCHSIDANVLGLNCVGGLVGTNSSSADISGCSATGNIAENILWSFVGSSVGGLVGSNTYYSNIENSYAAVNVSGNDVVGGLVGDNILYSTVENCYATGSVIGFDIEVGGLIGRNMAGTVLEYCYSSCIVTGPEGTDAVGGFVGMMGTGGSENYTACFWDSEINPTLPGIGNMTDPDVIGESTANMQTASTFTDEGWDFVDIWTICEGTNYPKFLWRILPADFLCPDGVDFLDYAYFSDYWLDTNCALSSDCDGTDFDLSGTVDVNDLKFFTDSWLTGL